MRADNVLENVYVIDDFLPDPLKVRQSGLSAHYINWLGPDKQVYKRISHVIIPDVTDILTDIFKNVDLLGMAFRLNYAGELPNVPIHSDIGWGSHALVIFLSEGSSGTTFWQHKKTGATRISPGEIDLLDQIDGDWDKLDCWKSRLHIEMKFNRAIIYSSNLFHSRYPFDAFGNCPDNGRLILVAFFTPGSI